MSNKIEISNPDKILFPESGIKKIDIIEYYKKISPHIMPFLKDRPLTLMRCPNGIAGNCFYQKNAPDFYPEWIERIPVLKQDGSTVNYINCKKKEALIYVANQACITLHPWLSKLPDLNKPDKLIFDLDPSGSTIKDFDLVKQVALIIKDVLEDLKLKPFIMTTGSKGIHVVTPIKPQYNFDEIRAFAKKIAELVAESAPEIATTQIRLAQRDGKVFLDYLRNSWSATSVAPYSVRTKENAPVATPIDWQELAHKGLAPDKYNISNIFEHLAKGDPWAEFEKSRSKLSGL